MNLSTATLSRAHRFVPHSAAVFVMLAGVMNIVGWRLDSNFLKDPFRTTFMAPNTALCLIVAGAALLLLQWHTSDWWWRALVIPLVLFVTLAGLLTLTEYLTGVDLGIDRIFMAGKLSEWISPNVLPGRFAPNTAVAFSCMGLALLFPSARVGRTRVSELLTLFALLISFLSVVGYTYGVEPLYGILAYSSMALHTAFCLAVLAIGILWSHTDYGIMAMVLGEDAGGVAARRLLLATIVILPFLGWLRLQAQSRGWLDLKFGTALLIIVSVVLFAFMIVRTSYTLRDLDEKRKRAEESLLASHAELESLVEQRTRALRRLSARLMQLQDEERRKIARELHDSLGQYMAGLSINLGRLERKLPDEPVLAESRDLLDRTIAEMRTLSHLLHPPLLDEIGFSSAAKWFVEEFAKRSGVEVSLDLPSDLPRLPQAVEIGLFRVLQESLTNIHRHSGSRKADIILRLEGKKLSLSIRDFGKGIPADVLERWDSAGTAGVGLTGMRERVTELGGELEVRNSQPGTTVTVSIPMAEAIVNVA